VFSPISGTVLSREVEVGQTINAGMQTPVLFVIAEDLRRMRLSSRVDEADIGAVVPGLRATFTVDAHPDLEFASEVLAVRNVPEVEQNVVSYEVILSVDNEKMLLKPGMTAAVEVITAKHADVMLVPNKALRFSPPAEGRGFRRRGPPMPFLGPRGRGKGEKKASPLAALGEVKAGHGVVWVLPPSKGPGAPEPKPVMVRRIATDGVQTAIQSDELHPGDAVVVDQADKAQEKT
jgi:HlyD family secretion protein